MNENHSEEGLGRDGLVQFLYRKHHDALLLFAIGWCKRFGLDRSYADDLVQEFYKAVLENHQKMARGYSLRGIKFLFQVIKYDLIDLARSRKSKDRVEQVYALGIRTESDIHYLCTAAFHQQFFQQLKNILPTADCLLMCLYLEGYSYSEISKKLRLNTNTVGVRIHRAKLILKQQLPR